MTDCAAFGRAIDGVPYPPKSGIISAIMETNNSITAAVFIAFLKCPTKAHLLAIGEPSPITFFTQIEARISSIYRSTVTRGLGVGVEVAEPLDFGELLSRRGYEAPAHPVDCKTAIYNFVLPSHEPEGCQSRESPPSSSFVPVLFSASDKPDVSDSLLVCFGALALSQITGTLADTGTVIYGERPRRKTVKIRGHAIRTRQTIDAIATTCNSREPPPLLLNRHCAVCDFQQRCRGLAIESDNLSLLSAMTGKERAKFHSKGIFSITQLPYGYRPRRRKRKRLDDESLKQSSKRDARIIRNDHKLKTLAIKKNQIHVVGAPSLKFDGTPTFLDVEGMPDRDFYYLVGLRFERDGEHVERSLWADELDGERALWENCLRELKAIGNAQIVS